MIYRSVTPRANPSDTIATPEEISPRCLIAIEPVLYHLDTLKKTTDLRYPLASPADPSGQRGSSRYASVLRVEPFDRRASAARRSGNLVSVRPCSEDRSR